MQMDKQLYMTKLIVPFHNFANVHNKIGIIKLKMDYMGQLQDSTYLLFILITLTKQNAKPLTTSLLLVTIIRIDTKQLTHACGLKLLTNNIH